MQLPFYLLTNREKWFFLLQFARLFVPLQSIMVLNYIWIGFFVIAFAIALVKLLFWGDYVSAMKLWHSLGSWALYETLCSPSHHCLMIGATKGAIRPPILMNT